MFQQLTTTFTTACIKCLKVFLLATAMILFTLWSLIRVSSQVVGLYDEFVWKPQAPQEYHRFIDQVKHANTDTLIGESLPSLTISKRNPNCLQATGYMLFSTKKPLNEALLEYIESLQKIGWHEETFYRQFHINSLDNQHDTFRISIKPVDKQNSQTPFSQTIYKLEFEFGDISVDSCVCPDC